jgi:hypothetical protein
LKSTFGPKRQASEEQSVKPIKCIPLLQAQGFLPETEWEEFMTAMRSDLPTAFRIMASTPESARRLLTIVEGQFFKELLNQEQNSGTGETAEIKKPFPLPW